MVFGASTGIGRITALEAGRRGARVMAADHNGEGLASLAEEAGAPDGFAIHVADAADADQVQAVADAAVARFGRLDTWAHVAGVGAHARFETWRWRSSAGSSMSTCSVPYTQPRPRCLTCAGRAAVPSSWCRP